MRQRISVAIIALLIRFLILGSSAFAQANSLLSNPVVTSNLRLIESWIEAQRIYRQLPGISVGIVYDQDLIYAKGFGYSDLKKKTPATSKTIYRIASITKTFTATAIMQLRDQGKLRLDDPIMKYLDWFEIKNRFPEAPEITIWHLLTHTSGLPRESAFPYWTDYQFPTREEMIDALPNQETVYPSEEKFKYSNLGFALAGEIVAAVSGRPYDKYIEESILKPLNMNDTRVILKKEDKLKLVTPYGVLLPDGTRKVRPFTDSKGITPAANMASNVEDLARYISFQFQVDSNDVNEVLKGSTLREMHRVHWLYTDWSWGWGLGFGVARQDDRTVVGHSGWVAGNRTRIAFVPEEKIGVIVLINAEDGNTSFFTRGILKLIAPAIARALAPPTPVIEADTNWLQYVGLYTDPSLFETEIMILNDKLVMYDSYPPQDDPLDAIVELTPEGNNTFRMTGKNGEGELVIFEMDFNGKVAKVKVGENYMYPKK